MDAIVPDGTGDVTARVVWTQASAVPEVPSPLVVNDTVLTVRNGGILTLLDAGTGTVRHRSRLAAPGPYFASPIEVDGKVLLSSGDEVVTVVTLTAEPTVLARNDLAESIVATPAVAGNRLFIRTASRLYAFGQRSGAAR